MVFHHFRRFGRQIFLMYETYPLVMNTMAGGVVYIAGEVTSQLQTKENINSLTQENWNQIMQIGLLGAGENGLAMLTWYKLLNTVVGSGVSTKIVLIKCVMDQIFFATQQDFLFLILCAYNQVKDLPIALADIQESFWTTWIMDCSLWPFVNFFGFAFVPYTLQPTYMACISYFWQLYISGIASKSSKNNHDELVNIFNEIDLDHNHVLDFFELKLAFDTRGVKVTTEEINEMILDAEINSTKENKSTSGNSDGSGENGSIKNHSTPHVKGKVTFEEFEVMVSTQCKAKSANNWKTILEKVPLTKGAKSAIKKLKDMNIKKNLNSTAVNESNNNTVNNQNNTTTQSTKTITTTSTLPITEIEYEYEYEHEHNDPSINFVKSPSSLSCHLKHSFPLSQEKINLSFAQRGLWNQPPMFHSSVYEPTSSSTYLMKYFQQLTTSSALSDREQAIRNVKWSLTGLTAIALFRMVVLKI